MKHVTLEREHFVTDMTVAWTLEITLFYRSLTLKWRGPAHAYSPDTPDYYRHGYDYEDDDT